MTNNIAQRESLGTRQSKMPDAESVEQYNGKMLLTFSERTNNFHYSQRFSPGGEAGLFVACGDFFEFSSRF